MPRKNAASVRSSKLGHKVWIDPDDAPEITDAMLDRAIFAEGEKVVRRGRPPLRATAKQAVKLRIDADVLTAYRALGNGWQSRINADLRKARKLKA